MKKFCYKCLCNFHNNKDSWCSDKVGKLLCFKCLLDFVEETFIIEIAKQFLTLKLLKNNYMALYKEISDFYTTM